MPVIDAHIHLGDNRQTKYYPVERMLADLAEAEADGPVVLAFPEDMYRIADTPESRAAANAYVLGTAATHAGVYPFYFVWNDFVIPDNLADYVGIKWHRHPSEPAYHYDDPRCEPMIREISRRRLPVVLEESFENTCRFVEELAPDAVIIIPHLGALNGSYRALERAGIWRRGNTYADTALAGTDEMRHFLRQYGPERLLFGSDFPFGLPAEEFRRVESLGLSSGDFEKVVGGNLRTLMAGIVP